MADVVNRTTLEIRRTVNTPDFSPAEWYIFGKGSDPTVLAGVGRGGPRELVVTGNTVRKTTDAEKTAYDADPARVAERRAQLTANKTILEAELATIQAELAR